MKTVSTFLIFVLLAIGHAWGQLTVNVTSPLNPIGYHVSSAGASDGSATAVSAGGVGNLSYLWSTGNVTPSISGLSAGTYSVSVTDGVGATASDTILLTEPPIGQCWTAYNSQVLDSVQFWRDGNAMLTLDTLDGDTILEIGFTCTDSAEVYGFGASFPLTDYLLLDFVPRHLSNSERFSLFDSLGWPIVDLFISPYILQFGHMATLTGDTVDVYWDDSITYTAPIFGDSLSIRNADLISAIGIVFDSLTYKTHLYLEFDHPIQFSFNNGLSWVWGDMVGLQLEGLISGPNFFDSLAYHLSASLPQVMLEGIVSRNNSILIEEDTIPIVFEPEPSDSGANDPARYISDPAMDALRAWSVMEDSLTPSIFSYLPQVPGLDTNEVQQILQDLIFPSASKSGSCRCKLFRTDVTVLSPVLPLWKQTDNTPNDNKGKYYNWSKSERSNGAAYRSKMVVCGHKQTGEEERVTNFHSASMEMINICVGIAGYPANCCPQTIKVRAWYDSRLTVRNKIRERRKSQSKAAAEDAVIFYAYEWTNGLVSPQILGAKQLGLYNSVQSSWNPAFFNTIFKLAGHIVDAIVGDNLTPTQTGSIAADIGTLLGTPAFILSGTPGGDSKPLEGHYENTLTLNSNVGKVIRLESQGSLVAGGAKKHWSAQADVGSDFLLVAKTMRNPDVNCCHNQDARWTLACLQPGPSRNQILRDVVGGFLFPERPWYNGNTGNPIPFSLFPGIMTITSNKGIALDTNFCHQCDAREVVNLSTGRGANTSVLLQTHRPDPNWEVLLVANGSSLPANSFTVNPNLDWAAPPPSSQWIAYNVSSNFNAPLGWYAYSRKFWIEELDPSVQLELEFLLASYGDVSVNGSSVYNSSANNFAGPPTRLIIELNDLVQGWNEILVSVYNAQGPHGIAVKALLSACPGVITASPPPTTTLPDLRLYPNPARGTLHVEGVPAGLVRYTVCDLSGRTLLETQSPDIDVRDLASGMYLLRVQSKGGVTTMRFVKE